ncbi:MAG: acetoacetate decarboxylase family protein, partial [Mycetocola sp.]
MRTTETFGTPDNPTGMLSIYGGRPGHLKEQEGAPLAVWETYVAEITTTVEALDKLIPAPLQRVDGRPVVYLAHLEATTWRGWDGINKPYTEIGLWVPVQYAGRVGISLFHLYLDGPGASQATIATREQFGVTKSIATIDASFNADWTEMWSTVVEYGRPRMYMHGKYSEEV